MTIKYIAFAGRKHSGKTTAASWIESQGYDLLSLAGPLKEAAKALFAFAGPQLYGAGKEVEDPFWGFTPREALQKLGTDGIRDLFGDDFWLKRLHIQAQMDMSDHVVVDDVRFPNEAKWFRDRGGVVIGIYRPALDVLPVDAHLSEQFANLETLRACSDVVITNPAPLVGLHDAVHRPSFLADVMDAFRDTGHSTADLVEIVYDT